MEPFRYHVYVCDQKKPDGAPCCSARGSVSVIDALRRELGARKLADEVQITISGSLGLCERGPNMVVYPDGVWYSGVRPSDIAEIVSEHFLAGRPVERLVQRDPAALRAEILGNRNKMLAALRAREAAGTVPDEIAGPMRAFQESRVLLTALELDVFSQLAEPKTAADVARAIGTDPRGTAALLDALAALEAVRKDGAAYQTAPAYARYLSAQGDRDARLALRHNLTLWEGWSHLTECVRTGAPAPASRTGGGDTEAFIGAMHRNAALRAPLVVGAVGTHGVARLIDIGGGSGAYSIAFANASPALEATVLDQPGVLSITRRHIEEAGLSARIRTVEGDLRKDSFGAGYDLALLSAICHMLGPDENRDLLRRVFAALAPGGRLAIQDHIMSDDKSAPRAGALFAINMLVNTPNGSTYSEGEYRTWLEAAGFADVTRVKLGGPNDLVIAERRR